MHNKIEILRWLLLIPSAIVGWYVALFIGILFYGFTDYFCPPEQMLSGKCQASWHAPLVYAVVIFGSSLSAVLVILFSVLMAPAKRVIIAKIAYISGFFIALYFAYGTSAWGAFSGAVISGALMLIIIINYLKGGNRA